MEQRLDLTAAERFVEKNPNARWIGWDIEIHRPVPAARVGLMIRSSNAAYRNGRWGYVKVISPDDQGVYVLPRR